MKPFYQKIGAVLLLTVLQGFAFAPSSFALFQKEKTLYVSLVKKNSVNRYFNRLATHNAHVVVTRQPVDHALASKTLTVQEDVNLVLVELPLDQHLKLPGEHFRLANIAVVEMGELRDIHDVAGVKSFAETIASKEVTVDPNFDRSANRIDTSTAPSNLTIEQRYLEEKLKLFTGASIASINGKAVTIKERGSKTGKDNARAFLKQEYEALGYTTSLQNYGLFNSGTNFQAERVGTDPNQILIVTSHMDSVSNAGADDNGSGTIGALAIAAALKDIPLRYTVRFVAFDQEENGLYGSAAYAKAINSSGEAKKVIGVINLEMTGYDEDNDGAFHVIDCNEGQSASLSAAVMKVVNRDELRLSRVSACTNRSDHASFWKYNVPAIVISQNFFGGDDNPCYHKSCDKVDGVQFDYMTRITVAVGRAVSEIVSAPN